MTHAAPFRLPTGGALLAAALPALADGQDDKDDADVLYGHGMVWNRDLPGVAGELNLSFDLRINLKTGTGFGTSSDSIHPEWNTQFAISSAEQEKLPGGRKPVHPEGGRGYENDDPGQKAPR